jgi:hypothetical protein
VARYADQTIRIADLAENVRVLSELEFERCEIEGPTVIMPSGCSFVRCSFGVLNDDRASLVWRLSPEMPVMQGVVILDRCSFTDCQFRRIGVALMSEDVDEFLSNLQPASSSEATPASPAGGMPVAS